MSNWVKEFGDFHDLPAWPEVRALDYKERLFVDNLVGAHKGDAKAAAKAAGFPSSDAFVGRLLDRPQIQNALHAFLSVVVGPNQLLAKLSNWAEADIGEFLSLDDRGTLYFDQAKVKNGRTDCIRKINFDQDGKLQSVEMYDAMAAVKLLMHYHGMIVRRSHNIQAKLNVKATSDDVRRKLLDFQESEPDAEAEVRGLPDGRGVDGDRV